MKTRYKIIATAMDKRGYVIARAVNSYSKTHPIQAYFAEKVGHPERKYLHAEIHAILKAKGKQIHHLIVEREGQDGLFHNAKPCPVCMEAIKAFGVKFITYSSKPSQYVTKEIK